VRLAGLLAALAAVLAFAGSSAAQRIVGTRASDLLLGTTEPDQVASRAGNDRVDVTGGGRDRVSCGAGADLVSADGGDRLAGDCEVVSRRISRDPYVGGEAQHATEAEPDSFAWGRKVVATFQVGRYSSGGAQSIGFAVSTDAGRTWRNGILPRLTTSSRPAGAFVRASDPAVAYDSRRGVWLIATLGIGAGDTALLISRSADGLHWSAPVVVARKPNSPDSVLFDKEWVACDNGAASPWRGRCYLSYSDIERVRLATQTSADGGLTWSAPVGSPDQAGRRGIEGPFAPGPQPVSLANGTLVVPIFDDAVSSVRSTDGGASFSPAVRVGSSDFHVAPGLRSAPLPSAEAGADGTIVLVWPGCAARSGCTGNDLIFSTTRDGLSWTQPTAIPLGPGNHVIAGIGADPLLPGRIAVAYYTESGGRLAVDLVWSVDGGTRWSRPTRLSPERMPYSRIAGAGGAMVGDYISTSFAGNRAVAVFTLAQSRLRGRLRQATYAASIAIP
jgi:hypothetical protein